MPPEEKRIIIKADKEGAQEYRVSVESAKNVKRELMKIGPSTFGGVLLNAIDDAEKVDGPFGVGDDKRLTFDGEVVLDAVGDRMNAYPGNGDIHTVLNTLIAANFTRNPEQ